MSSSLVISRVCVTAMLGIAALAGGMQGWVLKKTTSLERWLLIIAGLYLVYPRAAFDYIGLGLLIVVIVVQKRDSSAHKDAGEISGEIPHAFRGARHMHIR